jgi:hypothetical protein
MINSLNGGCVTQQVEKGKKNYYYFFALPIASTLIRFNFF